MLAVSGSGPGDRPARPGADRGGSAGGCGSPPWTAPSSAIRPKPPAPLTFSAVTASVGRPFPCSPAAPPQTESPGHERVWLNPALPPAVGGCDPVRRLPRLPLRFRRRPCHARALAPHRSRSLDPPPAPRAQGPGLAGLTGEHHRAAGGDPRGHGQGMPGGEAFGGAQPPGLLLPERPGRLVGLGAAGLRGRPKDVALLSRERDLVRAEDTGPGGTLNAQDQRPARVHAMK